MSTARKLKPVLIAASDPERAERRRLKRHARKRLSQEIALTPAEQLMVQTYAFFAGDIEQTAARLHVPVSQVELSLARPPVFFWCEYYLERRALQAAQNLSKAMFLTVEFLDAELVRCLESKFTPLAIKVALLKLGYGRLRVPVEPREPKRKADRFQAAPGAQVYRAPRYDPRISKEPEKPRKKKQKSTEHSDS